MPDIMLVANAAYPRHNTVPSYLNGDKYKITYNGYVHENIQHARLILISGTIEVQLYKLQNIECRNRI